MYDRLKTKNRQDPVNRQFHYRLSHGAKPGHLSTVDRILKSLNPDHGNPASAGQSSTQAPKNGTSNKGPSNAPVDDKTIQAIRNYKPEEPQTNFGPEIRVIAQDTTKGPLTKISYARERLEKASKEDFKKMILESAQNWFPGARDLVTEAMRQSPTVMKRIAKEFSPEEQTAAIGRAYDDVPLVDNPYLKAGLKPMHKEAMRAWMENTSEAALNQVIQDTKAREALSDSYGGFSAIKEQIKSGDFDIYQKLKPNNQAEIIRRAVEDPNMKSDFVQIQGAFRSAKDKNTIIDNFQKANPYLLPALLHRMPGINNDLLEGVNKENAQFIRETLLSMADREPNQSLANEYRQCAHFMKGWIEETFKQ